MLQNLPKAPFVFTEMISLELGISQPGLPLKAPYGKQLTRNGFAHKALPHKQFLESDQIQRDSLPKAFQPKAADLKPVMHTSEPFTGVSCGPHVLQSPRSFVGSVNSQPEP